MANPLPRSAHLTLDDYATVRKLHAAGLSGAAISRVVACNPSTVQKILKGRFARARAQSPEETAAGTPLPAGWTGDGS